MLNKKDFATIGLFVSLVFYPLFFRLDFSKSNYGFFDITRMVPNYTWVYLLILCLLLSINIWFRNGVNLMHVIVASLLVYGLFSISQYPMITSGDVYYHGRGTLQVIQSGNVLVKDYYPRYWPGAFIIWGSLSIVTGLDVVTTNIILMLIITLISSVMLYLLGKEILSQKWAGLAAIVYLVTNAYAFHLMGRDHFAPQSLGFTQYLLTLYLFIRIWRKKELHRRTFCALVLILIPSVVLSHLYTSLFLLGLLFGVTILRARAFEKIRRIFLPKDLNEVRWKTRIAHFQIFALVWSIAWLVFNPGFKNTPLEFEWLAGYISGLPTYFYTYFATFVFNGGSNLKIVPITQEPLSITGVILRNYYLKPLLLIAGLLSLIIILWDRRDRKVSIYSGIFFGSALGVIFSGILAPFHMAQFSELLMFSLLPVCYLASRVFVKRGVRISACILTLLILPTFLCSFTYSSEYTGVMHPWEATSIQFLTNQSTSARIVTDAGTLGIYEYFNIYYNPVSSEEGIALLNINYSSRLINYTTLFDDTIGDFIVRSFRQEFSYNVFNTTFEERQEIWSVVDSRLCNKTNLDRTYDNGFVQIYSNKERG